MEKKRRPLEVVAKNWSVWHPIEVPARVEAARAQYAPRHLADLLAAVGLPYWTCRRWARQPDRYPEWLAACEGVERPYRHELEVLRYLNKPTVAAIQARMAELTAAGRSDPEALYAAVDEIVGVERVKGEARRKAKRIARYGHDPVPDKRLTREERASVRPRRAEFAKRKETSNTKRRRGRNRKQQKRHLATRPGGPNKRTLRAYTRALFEARRKARWIKGASELFGVPFEQWPRKSPEQLAAERAEAVREQRREAAATRKPERAAVGPDVVEVAGSTKRQAENAG